VVLGSADQQAARQVATLYLSLRAPIIITDLYTAEMIKYASNAFLAAKISFINEIAQICERLGADVKEVAAGMGYDKRIGRAFLDAGLGYGGKGASVRVYDPVATRTGREALERAEVDMSMVTFCQSPYEAAEEVDALLIVTEWNEFHSLDMPRIRHAMRRPILLDGRNIYEVAEMKRQGFIYSGIGRGKLA